MLTVSDEPIIRRALTRRLDNESGVKVLEIKVKDHPNHIAVGLLLHVDDKIIVKSVFDLPTIFQLIHVHNEADEIAEQCKEARRNIGISGGFGMSEKNFKGEVFEAKGTGRRGRWRFLDGMRVN